jgi:site-specific recombinase XerD
MTIMRMFIKPVAKRLGMGNITWHTFRHTHSSLLHANGADPKVVQELPPFYPFTQTTWCNVRTTSTRSRCALTIACRL